MKTDPEFSPSFAAPRPSPLNWLAEVRAKKSLRITLPPVPPRPLSAACRQYFRALRAAEMAAWNAATPAARSANARPGHSPIEEGAL